MSSALAISGTSPSSTNSGGPFRLKRLWSDKTRAEQLLRLRALELQHAEAGAQAHQMAHEQWRQLPEGVRIDLPSPRVFAAVLGLYRTGAQIKESKLLQIELSAEEIGDLVGYSKSTIEATLLWLGCGAIEYQGMQVSRGLGLIHRGRRTAWAKVEGVLRRVYRTSRTMLTSLGRMILGLALRKDETRENRRKRHRPVGARKQRFGWHLSKSQPHGTDPPPKLTFVPPDPAPNEDFGKAWLKEIQDKLK